MHADRGMVVGASGCVCQMCNTQALQISKTLGVLIVRYTGDGHTCSAPHSVPFTEEPGTLALSTRVIMHIRCCVLMGLCMAVRLPQMWCGRSSGTEPSSRRSRR